MFTGLIAEVGEVAELARDRGGATLRVRTRLAGELGEGDSIAVNGVCLTASGVGGEVFVADLMGETLGRSSLGALAPGAKVNLELPLRSGERLGGHVVQGHVDATASVLAIHTEGGARILEVEVPEELERYLVEKGSVALDGVSLTISAVREQAFEVSLIPETLRRTNLGGLREGDPVNIEVDILAKHLERLIKERA
jgi:riboflavin synthase